MQSGHGLSCKAIAVETGCKSAGSAAALCWWSHPLVKWKKCVPPLKLSDDYVSRQSRSMPKDVTKIVPIHIKCPLITTHLHACFPHCCSSCRGTQLRVSCWFPSSGPFVCVHVSMLYQFNQRSTFYYFSNLQLHLEMLSASLNQVLVTNVLQ